MRLKTGNKAPSLGAESLSRKRVSPENHENHNFLIEFYRFATCPVYNLHLRSRAHDAANRSKKEEFQWQHSFYGPLFQ